jgi:ketosteroid isomerase-like protein
MSEENVEVVRRVVTEFAATQRLSELVAPDVVWHVGSWAAWTGPPEFHGHDGFGQFFTEWIDAYEEWTQEVESITDAGGSKVVVATSQRGRPRGSGSWVTMRVAFLYTVENGQVQRGEVYGSPEEALEAAGLSG